MHRIDSDTAVAVMPAPAPAGDPGFFTRGNPGPGTPVPATNFTPEFCNAVQEELAAIATLLGDALDKTDNGQVLSVLLRLAQAQVANYAVATGTGNAQVIALNPPVTARKIGAPFRFKPVAANTGAMTLDYGAGAIAVVAPTNNGINFLGGVLSPAFIYTAIDNGTNIVITEFNAIGNANIWRLPTVSVPNTGVSVQICPPAASSAGGVCLVSFDDGASNTIQDIVPWHQFMNTALSATENSGGSPGTRSYTAPNVTGGLNMARSGGPATVNVNVCFIAR